MRVPEVEPDWYQRTSHEWMSDAMNDHMEAIARLRFSQYYWRDQLVVTAQNGGRWIARRYTRLELREKYGYRALSPWL